MRVAVIGAGLAGVTSAYELALRGFEVTVFERRGSVAAEASFALPGVAAALAPLPWGLPGLAEHPLSRWWGRDATLPMGGALWWLQAPWLARRWRAQSTTRRIARLQALSALAEQGVQRLDALTAALHLECEQHAGALVLLRRQRELESVKRALAQRSDSGATLLDEAHVRDLEPSLASDPRLLGAVLLPQARAANARLFAQQLKNHAQRLGARFVFDTAVARLRPGGPPRLETADGDGQAFDALVVCAGHGSGRLLDGAGLRLRLATVHAYALTAPLAQLDGLHADGPRSAVIDARSGISVVRLGQRVRVAGVHEFGGAADRLAPAALRTLYRALEATFPGSAVSRLAQPWKGAKAYAADGLPRVGASGLPGVWLNLGHGASNWAVACGAAPRLAQALVEQRDGAAGA